MSKRKGTKTRYPGVRRISAGRYHVHVKAVCWKTGKVKEEQGEIDCDGAGQAAAIRAQMKATIEGKTEGATKRVRFADFCESWMRQKAAEVKRSSARNYAETASLFVRHLGDHYVDAITAADMVMVRNCMLQTVKPVTVNARLDVARTIFRSAVALRLIDRSPTDTLKDIPVHKRPKVWQVNELRLILDTMRERKPSWYDHCYLLATTGLRFGELAGLCWDDIDEDREVIHVRRAYWDGQDQKSTKTGKDRDVPLPPTLAALLRQRRQRMIQDQHPRLASGLVFPTRRSDASPALRHARYLNAPLKEVLDHLGLPGSVHWFRHSFNDILRRTTTDAVLVQEITGHSSLAMMANYSDVRAAERAAASGNVVRLISGTEGGTGGSRHDGNNDATRRNR